jgi:hypothetical protein
VSWTVRIESEDGRSLRNDVDISFDAVPYGPEYPICNSVARYYVTLLNPPQLESFVREWDNASSTAEFAHLKASKSVRDIAERCARDHLYVRFVGD